MAYVEDISLHSISLTKRDDAPRGFPVVIFLPLDVSEIIFIQI